MTDIYPSINQARLLQDASSCILKSFKSFHPDIITRSSGSYIYNASGHKMLDWTSGQMSCLIGHGNPEVVEVIKKHAESLDHTFSTMLTPPVVSLAKQLTSLTPPGLDKALFLNTGAESNEAAMRLAKFYTGKFEIVALSASWHGMTSGALGAQYQDGRRGYGPVMPGNFALPAPNPYRSLFRHPDNTHDWETELHYGFSLIDRSSCGSLAAIILEPIMSSGGIHPLPPDYLSELRKLADARGMLIICDEAQTALGRAGDMFAFMHDEDGFVPDILTLSKTLGNGLPLSAVICSDKVASFAEKNGFFLYSTHLNDPLTAAVGSKVVEIVVRDDLVSRARDLGHIFQAALCKLQQRYACIGDVRGRGLMAGLEIVSDRETKAPGIELGERLGQKMAELGLWAKLGTQQQFSGVFRFAPPVTTTEDELNAGLEILDKAFAETEGVVRLY